MTLLRHFGCCATALLFSMTAARAADAQYSLRFGAAWYPEQWNEQRWDHDLQLMKAAHVNVVRVAEFAWSSLEPREGQYDFGWLDRAIAKAATYNIKVVIGTPTATPPAWLTQHYPDVLRVNENGTVEEHGNRLQYSFASPRYRTFARDIAEKLAVRYGKNPNVIGWQIDNEVAPVSYDAAAKDQFHLWLKARYGTVEALNTRWTTAYWSETYTNFDQVPMHTTYQNPGLQLAFKRFVTDTWTSYIKNQVDVVRAHARPDQFVTTNSMHWHPGYDHFKMHADLDLAAWDNYIPDGHFDWVENARDHDIARGYKRKNFWVMESQAGFVNYGAINRTLDPGVMREMAWQAVGHGADALLYWQWRSPPNGQEQYYGSLLGADGEPAPFYREAKTIGAEFAKASQTLDNTSPLAAVAMIQSYDSRWSMDFQRHHKDFDPVKEFTAFYKPLVHTVQTLDIVSPEMSLDRYKLVVAPALNVLTTAQAERLAAYVRAGGHLVLGPRSGMKDDDNSLWTTRQPGPLKDVLGGHVEQYYALEKPIALDGMTGTGQAAIWGEELVADAADTRVLMHYTDGSWLAGKPAALTRNVGKGTITYLGAWLDDATMRRFLAAAAAEAGAKPVLTAPDDIEVCERRGDDKRIIVVINHGSQKHSLRLPQPMRDVLRGAAVQSTLSLPPHGVAVLLSKGKTAP